MIDKIDNHGKGVMCIQRSKDVMHVTHETSEGKTYISLGFLHNVQHHIYHQHVNIILKPCA
jgi:hypothetical protein